MRIRALRPVLLVTSVLVSLAGCRAERITTTDVPIMPATDQAWSGGTLVLNSAAFTGADTAPTVTVGQETLVVQSLGSGALLVQLPDTNGAITLAVHLASGNVVQLSAVRVHGFIAAGAGPRLEGTPYPWPGNGTPTAVGFQDGRLVLVDYRYNTALPLIPDYYWPAMQLARGHWLTNTKYECSLFARAVSGGFTVVASYIPSCDEMSGFAISPRGDRVIPFQNHAFRPGTPVFEPGGPSVAYTLMALGDVGGVAFSEAGDTIFASGADTNGVAVFVALDATSGRVLASAPLAAGMGSYVSSSSVAMDPNRPWVYVADQRNGLPYVDVFERASLAHLASLRVPPSAIQDNLFMIMGDYVLVISPVERRLYLTVNRAPSSSRHPSLATHVLRFDLVP